MTRTATTAGIGSLKLSRGAAGPGVGMRTDGGTGRQPTERDGQDQVAGRAQGTGDVDQGGGDRVAGYEQSWLVSGWGSLIAVRFAGHGAWSAVGGCGASISEYRRAGQTTSRHRRLGDFTTGVLPRTPGFRPGLRSLARRPGR